MSVAKTESTDSTNNETFTCSRCRETCHISEQFFVNEKEVCEFCISEDVHERYDH